MAAFVDLGKHTVIVKQGTEELDEGRMKHLPSLLAVAREHSTNTGITPSAAAERG